MKLQQRLFQSALRVEELKNVILPLMEDRSIDHNESCSTLVERNTRIVENEDDLEENQKAILTTFTSYLNNKERFSRH